MSVFIVVLSIIHTSWLEVHSAERIYLRQRYFDAWKPRIAASTGTQYQYVGFSQRNKILHCSAYDSKPRNATGAQYGFSWCNKISRCSAYAMGESSLVPASRQWSGSGSRVDQFVHVPTSVDMQNVIEIHAVFLSNLASLLTHHICLPCQIHAICSAVLVTVVDMHHYVCIKFYCDTAMHVNQFLSWSPHWPTILT